MVAALSRGCGRGFVHTMRGQAESESETERQRDREKERERERERERARERAAERAESGRNCMICTATRRRVIRERRE